MVGAMIFSKCAICGSKKSRFFKNQEAKGLLSNLGIKTPLSKVPILDDNLFWSVYVSKRHLLQATYKNERNN